MTDINNKNSENVMLEKALYYSCEQKYSIIPVGKNKKPLIPSWKEYQKIVPLKWQVVEWWTNSPDANIGLITGTISGIEVVDFDLNKETKKFTPEAEEIMKKLPPTLTAITGSGGKHFFYKLSEGSESLGCSSLPSSKVDFKSEGGYVLIDPSVNENGKYQFEKNENELIESPRSLLKEIFVIEKNGNRRKRVYNKIVNVGDRNNSVASFIGTELVKYPEEQWEEIVLSKAIAFNRKKCNPPMEDSEVETTFYSICSTHKRNNPEETQGEMIEEEKIDTSQFKQITNQEILKTLGLTIKKDETNKLMTFYGEMLAYTEDAQINLSYNAPSSTGKSYIPTEIAQLFPNKDVIEVGYCSPTAFFHDAGAYNKETNTITVDLSRKILIFLDQPHTQLIQHLRPLLSHDKKEILIKITDKSQKAGHRTKNVLLRGYPTVVFCTAGMNIDEQESTRFILLSPETSNEKIREAIYEKIKKETNKEKYKQCLEENPERQHLKNRIKAIKQENIQDIRIGNSERVEELFFNKFDNDKALKPRHQRDIGKIMSLIKGRALINLWFREREDSTIIANDEDIEEGFNLWCEVSESQDLNLPPYVYKIYKEVIVPTFEEKQKIVSGVGLTKEEVMKKHYEIYGRNMQDWYYRQQVIPPLENAGLIYLEKNDPKDKRKVLLYLTDFSTKVI